MTLDSNRRKSENRLKMPTINQLIRTKRKKNIKKAGTPALKEVFNTKKEEKFEIARNMLAKGLDISLISEITGLSVEEIRRTEI